MDVIIAYDVSQRQSEVKRKLLENGFMDRWTNSQHVTYYLPNTTLWHNAQLNPTSAHNLFNAVIAELNKGQQPNKIIKIERFIANQFVAGWSAIPGEPHA